MSELFKPHCESHTHCATCRLLQAGRSFRKSLRAMFADVVEDDFKCPESKPWIADALTYEEVCDLIDSAPDEGLWIDLKHERKLHAKALALYVHNTPCWKRKQKNRIVNMYNEVLKKMNKGVA